MSGTVCCYSGCKKSYSTDKDVCFFKFPDDPKRRKKWMQRCGNLELENLSDRQLRGKRICSDHFLQNSFLRPESRTALTDSAVPILARKTGLPASTPSPGRKSKKVEQVEKEEGNKAPTVSPNKTVAGKTRKRKLSSDATDDSSTPIAKEKGEAETLPTPPPNKKVLDSGKKSPQVVEKTKKEEKTAAADTVSNVVTTVLSKNSKSVSAVEKEIDGKLEKRKGKKVISTEKSVVNKTPNVSPSNKTVGGKARKRKLPSSAADNASTPTAKEISEIEPASPPIKKALEGKKSPPEVVKTKKDEKSATADAISSIVNAVLSKNPKSVSAVEKEVDKKLEKRKSKKVVNTEKSGLNKTPIVSPPNKTVGGKARKGTVSPAAEDSSSSSANEKGGTEPTAPANEKVMQNRNEPSSQDVEKTKESEKSAAADAISSVVNAVLSKNPKSVSNVDKEADGKLEKRKRTNDKPILTSTPVLVKVKVEPQSTPVTTAKKVSMEAMMAAVSSTKAPVISSNPSKPKIISSSTPTQELSAQNKPKTIKPTSKPSVEIVREKPKNGNNTVVVVRQGDDDNLSDDESYDEYMYYDREFDFEQEEDGKTDREFERFHASLKKFLRLPGKWTMGGVQWDPQGRRKVIIISEAEIPPSGKPCVKRCLQCFEDKSIRVFIDQMDMTDVFGMTCYAEKEDVAGLINRIADASSCCGVPEMVVDDLIHFPNVRKRNTSYFDPDCPGVIPNDAYDPICSACKNLQVLVKESREKEKRRLLDRRIRSEQKQFQHPFGEALYSFFNDLADETDPSKPKKKRTKETFFRKFLHDTRLKVNGDSARTERVYIEKPISVDSVSQSFQDIVSKLGFNMPNAKKRPSGGLLPRPSTSTPRPTNRILPGSSSSVLKADKKIHMPVEHILPFTPGSSFTLDDGQEYELIGEVEPTAEFVEMKPVPSAQQQQQFEIIEVDDETLARLASSKNQVVMLPEATTASIVPSSLPLPLPTRIDANDPNLSQILKAINTSHGFKVS